MKSPGVEIEKESKRDVETGAESRLVRLVKRYATVIGLVLAILLFFGTKPTTFLTPDNIRNILVAVAVGGVVAVGQTFVFALFDFDMSQGSTAEVVGVICCALMAREHVPVAVVVPLFLVAGAMCGAINGFLVAYVNLNPFITTMGTLTAFQGVSFIWTRNEAVSGIPKSFINLGNKGIGPVPYLVIIMVVIAVLGYFLMERTVLGRRWYAAGGNREASFLAGLDVRRLRFLAFVACGTMSGLGALMLSARLAEATQTMGDALTLNAISAVFLGMTAFKDGLPNIAGTIVGVLFMGVLVNGMAINYVNSYIQLVVTGFVVIAAVGLAGLLTRKRGGAGGVGLF